MKLPFLAEIESATSRYLETLTSLTDEQSREPSTLPGWSRGHVITHLARNADALVNLLDWAATGVPSPMYPSQEQRDRDVDEGAGRPADELCEDAITSARRFAEAARRLGEDRLEAAVTRLPGTDAFPVLRVGGMRRTEVEVHHADLLLGYTARDWPEDFVDHLLDRRQKELDAAGTALTWRRADTGAVTSVGGGGPEIAGHPADLAWWLIGRGSGDGLIADAGELPPQPSW